MNIQRYDLEPGSESMQRFPDGDYVLHADHLDAVKQARADALRWVLEQLEQERQIWTKASKGIPPYQLKADGVTESCTRMRAIIEKELSK